MITSRPYRPNQCCEACVFGATEHTCGRVSHTWSARSPLQPGDVWAATLPDGSIIRGIVTPLTQFPGDVQNLYLANRFFHGQPDYEI